MSPNFNFRLLSYWRVISQLCLLGLVLVSQSHAAESAFVKQNPVLIQQKVEEYLRIQSQGAPGKVVVTVGAVDSQLQLERCVALEATLPSGSRAWGKTTVAVRCTTPSQWTIYVQANVSIFADYLVASVPLAQGKTISLGDITFINGDLTTLPAGIFTDVAPVLGQVLSSSLSAGSVLRQDMLRSPLAIKQGQSVRLMTNGNGFSVSTLGYALGNASIGQMVQAKTASGKVVSGIVKGNGEIEVNY